MNPIWGEWSEWAWDGTHGRWYRGRQDIHGNVQWEYNEPNASAPRRDVENLAASFNNVNIGDDQGASYTQDGAYTYDAPIAAAGAADASVYSTSAASSVQAQAASFHGKGKSRAVNQPSKSRSKSHKDTAKDNWSKHPSKKRTGKNDVEDSAAGQLDRRDPFYRRSDAVSGTDYLSAASTVASAQQQAYSDSAYGSSPHDPSYASGLPQGHSADRYYDQGPTVDPNDGAETADPERHTHRGRTSGSGAAYTTSSVAADPPTEGQESEYHSAVSQDSPSQEVSSEQLQDALSQADAYLPGYLGADYSGGESSSMAAVHSYPYPGYPADGGRDTPKPFPQQAAAAAVAEDYSHQADTSDGHDYTWQLGVHDGYVVEHSSKFRPGMIFKILWCEPLGDGGHKSEAPTHHVRVQQGGRTFYQGLRRFIVVANDEGHCTCVPILTYERQACLKRGVKPLKHGIVYQNGKSPRMLQGEPRLGFDPVRVHLTEKTEGLVKESRVNYAKLTTVEHNFRVYFIGYVDPDDFEHIVMPAVDYCWQKKKRHNYRD